VPETFASEAGHYYRRDGSPLYTVVGKNGKERATTLRDARSMDLVPSVTTITALLARPGLDIWKGNQLILAALTLPRIAGETEKEFVARVWEDSREQARKAAEGGTALHGTIEKSIRGEAFDPAHLAWVMAIEEALPPQKWETERSFAHREGFGGKVDLHSAEWVIDFKTKDGDLSNVQVYDEHAMQLAGYRRGLDLPRARCANLFISRDTPKAVLLEHDEEDLQRGDEQFLALLEFWKVKNRLRTEAVATTIRSTR
jgi:hypothetical protein